LKRQAIQNEDFDIAKQLKTQIDMLKASAYKPDGGNFRSQPMQMQPRESFHS
jgi:hypothetical protein